MKWISGFQTGAEELSEVEIRVRIPTYRRKIMDETKGLPDVDLSGVIKEY